MFIRRKKRSLGVAMAGIFFLIFVADATTYQDYLNAYNTLMSNYNINLRPVRDLSTVTNVSVSFVLLSIEGLSEQDQVLKTNGWLLMRWIDEILTWDVNTTGVSSLNLQQKAIWKPDVTIKNTAKQRGKLGFDEQPIFVSSKGEVTWAAGDIFVTSCDLVVTYYPFDYQICEIVVYLWESPDSEIKLYPAQKEVKLNFFSKNGLWDIVQTAATSAVPGGFTEITFSIKLKRREAFFVMNIIVPILFLSCLAPLVFALPPGSGEKMGFSVTVLLAYTVFLTILGDSMPRTSIQTSILSVYLTAMLIISAASVILTTLVLRIHDKSEDSAPSTKLRNITRALRRVLCFNSSKSSNTVNPEVKEKVEGSVVAYPKEEITWKKVAETLDFFLFCVFAILTLSITVPSLVTMATHKL